MSTGKIELSVGAVKIANKYEIFTEEEIDAINNKIPELDERVDVIKDEIDEINSSLDNIKIYVTPQMYGAKGDGITNDTEAFRLALNSSKLIVIPIGTYLIDELIVDNHTIIGLDKKYCILKATSTNGDFIYNNNEKTDYFSMKNITVDFKNSGRNYGDGIKIVAIKCYLSDVCVNYSPGNGVNVQCDAGNYADPDYNLSSFENISINMSGYDGLLINKTYDLNLHNVNVSSCGVKEDKIYSCIHIKSSCIKVSDSHFWNWWGGESDIKYALSTLYIEDGGNNCFTNCHFEGGLCCANIKSTANLFTNCSFYAVKDEYMIKLGGSRNVFTSCRFDATEVSDKVNTPKSIIQISSPTGVYSNIFRDCYYTLPIIDYTLNSGQGKNIFTGYLFANGDEKKNYYYGELNRRDEFSINSNFGTNNFNTNINSKKKYHNYKNTYNTPFPTVLINGNYTFSITLPIELTNIDFTFDTFTLEVLNTTDYKWRNLTSITTFTIDGNTLNVTLPQRDDISGSPAKVSFYSRFLYN